MKGSGAPRKIGRGGRLTRVWPRYCPQTPVQVFAHGAHGGGGASRWHELLFQRLFNLKDEKEKEAGLSSLQAQTDRTARQMQVAHTLVSSPPSPAPLAGAFCDGSTIQRSQALGLSYKVIEHCGWRCLRSEETLPVNRRHWKCSTPTRSSSRSVVKSPAGEAEDKFAGGRPLSNGVNRDERDGSAHSPLLQEVNRSPVMRWRN